MKGRDYLIILLAEGQGLHKKPVGGILRTNKMRWFTVS